MCDFNYIEKLLTSRNRFKLAKAIEILDLDRLICDLSPCNNSDENDRKINVLLSCICTCLPNSKQLESSLLNALKEQNPKFKLNREFFYHLIRANNKPLLNNCIAFANSSLSQDLKQQEIGEYFNPERDESTVIRAVKLQDEELVRICIEQPVFPWLTPLAANPSTYRQA
jgi:hypothetical protein